MNMQKANASHQAAENMPDDFVQSLVATLERFAELEIFADGREDLPPQVRVDLTVKG